MTAQQRNQNTDNGSLERLLDGIQRKVADIGKDVRVISERVTELGETADAIYEAISYHRDSPECGHAPNAYCDETDE